MTPFHFNTTPQFKPLIPLTKATARAYWWHWSDQLCPFSKYLLHCSQGRGDRAKPFSGFPWLLHKLLTWPTLCVTCLFSSSSYLHWKACSPREQPFTLLSMWFCFFFNVKELCTCCFLGLKCSFFNLTPPSHTHHLLKGGFPWPSWPDQIPVPQAVIASCTQPL